MRGQQSGNPFYIDPMMSPTQAQPGQAYTRGLAIKTARDLAQEKVDSQRRQEEAMTAWSQAQTPSERVQIMRAYPDFAKTFQDQYTFESDQTKEWHANDYKALHNAKDIPTGIKILQDRAIRLRDMGIDNSDTIDDLKALMDGNVTPEDMRAMAEIELRGTDQGMTYLEKSQELDTPPDMIELEKLMRARERIAAQNPNSPMLAKVDQQIAQLGQKDESWSQVSKMPGWSFNNNTGQFKFNEGVAALMQTEAANLPEVLDSKSIVTVNDKVTALTKPVNEIYNKAQALRSLKARGTPAARMASVFMFMKAMDPSSTVRETEQGQVYSAAGPMAEFAGMLNSVVGKGKLNDAVFADIVATAEELSRKAIETGQGEVDNYLEVIKTRLPEDVYDDLRSRLPQWEAAPPVEDADRPGFDPLDLSTLPRTNAQGWRLGKGDDGKFYYWNPQDTTQYELAR